jgi:hypothetical protein
VAGAGAGWPGAGAGGAEEGFAAALPLGAGAEGLAGRASAGSVEPAAGPAAGVGGEAGLLVGAVTCRSPPGAGRDGTPFAAAPSGDGEGGRSTAGVDTTPRGRPTVAASPRLTGRVGSSGLAGQLDAASAAEPRAGASASCSAVVPPGVDCRSGMR